MNGQSAQDGSLPSTWICTTSAGRLVRFVETRYTPDDTKRQAAEALRATRVEVRPMSLREISPVVPIAAPAFAQDTAGATVLVDRTSPPEIIDQPPLRRRDARRRHVILPMEVAGLPARYRSQGTYAESRLELRGGEVLESRQSTGAVAVLAGTSSFSGDWTHHLQGVLGEVRVLPATLEPGIRPRVTVLTVTGEQLARHGTEPGCLVSTLHIPLQHSRAVGALPLAAGERLRLRDMHTGHPGHPRRAGRRGRRAAAEHSEERSLHRYAPDKWSIRQVLSHINDTERVFTFRALWFARGFDAPLPSFDQNAAIAAAGADKRPWTSHPYEWRTIRRATLTLFRHLPADAWLRRGVASGNPFTVRALAYITAGQVTHHLRILKELYL